MYDFFKGLFFFFDFSFCCFYFGIFFSCQIFFFIIFVLVIFCSLHFFFAEHNLLRTCRECILINGSSLEQNIFFYVEKFHSLIVFVFSNKKYLFFRVSINK